MIVPSFLYSALDQQTLRMAQELALLGGGDCKAINMEVHCIIDDRLSKSDSQIIWLNDESVSVLVKDSLAPLDGRFLNSMKDSKALKEYKATSTSFLHDVLQCPPENFIPLKYVTNENL